MIEDNVLTFQIRPESNLEDITNEYPKVKILEQVLDKKYTFLNKHEIKIRIDKESVLKTHYVNIWYRFDMKTSIEDKVKTVLFTIDEISQLFDESIAIHYFVIASDENSNYPELTASGKTQSNGVSIDKNLLSWSILSQNISESNKKVILEPIADITDEWYSNK